ncbi:sigma-70 family RNA polymerase sigma factor [Achromobacter sp. UMC46]|uniref:sigma-70 family RNA polymerase sigma factor n=1 Tax=Achromobacter sp. UMC46 TaxID=1862319 RepID=UPI0016003094|nr:sigma-70 family RNA polymerase sigma factor [Achromobacter sp. UMC46]MBB1597512.1 hypothetical protein [Achromobacter sp. UMC46]
MDTSYIDTDSQGDPHAWLVSFREQMLRFAHLQLGQAEAAQDAVQEALAAALDKRGALDDSAAFKQWIFGILKHKIVDQIRGRARLVGFGTGNDEDEAVIMDTFFQSDGEWRAETRPTGWEAPEESMHSKQFWRIFMECLERLPAANARIFMMREYLGFESAEICERMGLTSGALHAAMHRARLRLRSCLDMNWFKAQRDESC